VLFLPFLILVDLVMLVDACGVASHLNLGIFVVIA